jgi:hypothetical protein
MVVVAMTNRKAPIRLGNITAIAAVSAPLLAGCFGSDDSKKLSAQDRKCEQLGFKRGTPEHINCRFEQARQATPRGGEAGTD